MALNLIGKRGLQLRTTDLPVSSIHLGLFYCSILLSIYIYRALTCSGLDKVVVDIIAN